MIHALLTALVWWFDASLILAIVKALFHFPHFEENR